MRRSVQGDMTEYYNPMRSWRPDDSTKDAVMQDAISNVVDDLVMRRMYDIPSAE